MKIKRSFRHWSLQYFRDRMRLMAYERKYRDAPWLTWQATEILESWLRPTDFGIEWGSGRSTVWLARRVEQLTSIEHDQEWHKRVSRMLHTEGIRNCQQLFLSSDKTRDGEPEYVAIPSGFPKKRLDFALIDGRLRDQCTEVALQLLKPGGLLIIDNAARYIPHTYCCPESKETKNGPPSKLWAQVVDKLAHTRCIWTSNGIWATALYFLPITNS